MDCREANRLISPYLDEDITDAVAADFKEHVASCSECSRELAVYRKLSGALREIGREEMQAPPELCGLVMGRLRQERRNVFSRLPAAWRRAVAAAAAVLLIAGSSAGVNAAFKAAGGGKMIGYETPAPKVSIDAGSGMAAPEKGSGDSGVRPDSAGPPDNAGAPVVNGGGSSPENVSGNDGSASNIAGNSGAGGSTTSAAGASSEAQRVLLSSGMKVTSTVLKMTVDDLTTARAKAVALAAGSGAETQVFPEQNGDKKIVVIRLTMTSNQAPGLFAGLTGLGTLIDRQDESRDITSIYNETLVQYRDLQSRAGSAPDAGERRQLEAQAASYKQQLDAWEAEAGKRVIMLWLESR